MSHFVHAATQYSECAHTRFSEGEMKPRVTEHVLSYTEQVNQDRHVGLRPFTWLHLGKSRVSTETQTVCCGVKSAVEVGVLGERFMMGSDQICSREGISEKTTWQPRAVLIDEQNLKRWR